MRELFSLDQHNYKEGGKEYSRPSVRGIILQDGKVLLVHSKKFGYMKFPGGGIEPGEDHVQALCREVREETGLEVAPESVREFGFVPRRQKDKVDENGIFVQDNFYYFCDLKDGVKTSTKLDDYEREEGFTPVWMEPFFASQRNRYVDLSQEGLDAIMVKREAKVLDLVDLEARRIDRKEHEKKILEALGRPEYFEMLEFVKEQLDEERTEHARSGKIDIAYSRYDHTRRVLAWVLRLYEGSKRKDEIRFDELVIATIFHDVGRNPTAGKDIPHALAGVPITKKYLEERGYAPEKVAYVCDLVARHSDKHRMREEGLDPGLLMLMEADLIDDMGALGIVMDCMITESRNPDARFEDCLDHMTRYTLRQQEEENPMVSPEAIAFWDEKTRLARQFVEALRRDVML
ncbi:MAG: NUDIX domain-containing protein [Lachnospiraceae bacterium]|nr:NUDIX domain-containing protein [Lachnospiraceae bacterium]